MIAKLIQFIGTGFGTGYVPIAPGTAGSLLALLFYFLFPFTPVTWLIISIIVFLAGIWISGIIESNTRKDPSEVVIDEFVGQWVSLLFLPRYPLIYIGGFFLFRFFDIVKPFPANVSQKINGGFGIMLDDICAGVYANFSLQLIVYLFY
jgi:phosphatidylglycerophosphatase A